MGLPGHLGSIILKGSCASPTFVFWQCFGAAVLTFVVGGVKRQLPTLQRKDLKLYIINFIYLLLRYLYYCFIIMLFSFVFIYFLF